MNINGIKKLATANDVRVSLLKEQGKRVIGLHGFSWDIEAVTRQITGYHIKQRCTGHYLYPVKANQKY